MPAVPGVIDLVPGLASTVGAYCHALPTFGMVRLLANDVVARYKIIVQGARRLLRPQIFSSSDSALRCPTICLFDHQAYAHWQAEARRGHGLSTDRAL